MHKKADKRESWQYHGVEAWYVGPSLEHYRCYKCYVPTTGAIVDCDKVKLIPHNIPIPEFTNKDVVTQAIKDIIHVLKTSQETNIPKFWRGDAIQNAFHHLADLLQRDKSSPSPPEPTTENNTQTKESTLPVPAPQKQLVTRSLKQNQETMLPSKAKVTPYDNTPPPRPVTPPSPTSVIQPIPVRLLRVQLNNTYTPALPRVEPPTFPHLIPHSPFPKIWSPVGPSQLVHPTLLANHIFDENGKKQSIDDLITGPNKKIWLRSTANELCRLAAGIPGRVEGTKTVAFIHKSQVPKDKRVTYANMVCDYRPLKTEQYRVRLTIGGDKLEYFDETASPAASLLETKLILNSTISDAHRGARFMSLDLKDHFLQSNLPPGQREYMRIHSKYFDKEFRLLSDIDDKIADDGYVYCEIQKGIYGLKQAAILAYKLIVERLAPFGYYPIPASNGLWKHKTRKTIFALCVDDFGVKYFNDEDADHLINALKKYYTISIDREGKNYCGLTIDWNYPKRYVDIHMPNFVTKALHKFQHSPPPKPQYAPHKWTKPAYGSKTQYAPEPDRTDRLDAKGTRLIQSIVVSVLYYGRAIDSTILPALNEISAQQSKPTKNTLEETDMLMDYLHTYPNGKIRYFAGSMQLMIDSDAAYLVLPGAKSRIAGHYMLEASQHPDNYNRAPHNGAILIECRTLKHVVCSAAEAECGGLFQNSQNAIALRTLLREMGHPQLPTRIKTDNKTANSFVHASMRVKRSKSWDMRYHWLREAAVRAILNIYWDKGSNNDADYFTKHHPPAHHRLQRSRYILKGFSITQLGNVLSKNPLWARVCSAIM